MDDDKTDEPEEENRLLGKDYETPIEIEPSEMMDDLKAKARENT